MFPLTGNFCSLLDAMRRETGSGGASLGKSAALIPPPAKPTTHHFFLHRTDQKLWYRDPLWNLRANVRSATRQLLLSMNEALVASPAEELAWKLLGFTVNQYNVVDQMEKETYTWSTLLLYKPVDHIKFTGCFIHTYKAVYLWVKVKMLAYLWACGQNVLIPEVWMDECFIKNSNEKIKKQCFVQILIITLVGAILFSNQN